MTRYCDMTTWQRTLMWTRIGSIVLVLCIMTWYIRSQTTATMEPPAITEGPVSYTVRFEYLVAQGAIQAKVYLRDTCLMLAWLWNIYIIGMHLTPLIRRNVLRYHRLMNIYFNVLLTITECMMFWIAYLMAKA